MSRLRRWLIHKLGGFTTDGIRIRGEIGGYWDKEFIDHTLYIHPDDYTKENAESIERELANQLAEKFLKKECLFFMGPYKDHDELRITACCTALRLHERKPHHLPNHLVFEEESK